MDALAILKDKIMAVLETLERQGVISAGLDTTSIAIETPKDDTFGDLSSNVAMVLSKQAKRNPRELAKYFVDQFANDSSIETVEVAGPGFLNFKLKNDFWIKVVV
ncbi:MAG: arginine--tRNA ligase, partial [Pseudomonadota bacterium]|nr:arginine--tRNA ligase [Pseudomonadota bacterium]